MTDDIRFVKDGPVAELVLDRPRKLNAVTPEMAGRIDALCRAVDRDDDVRVLLVRGEGDRAFCAGSDLSALAQYPTPWAFRNRSEYATSLRQVGKPVVAALHGWVLGGGAELALSADLRVLGRGARIGFPEVTRGWVGGGGASQMLPRLVGYGQAMRLLLLGEPVGAEEAFRLGMAEFLVDDSDVLATARDLCRRIAAFNPVATQSVKASVRMTMQAHLDAGIRYENEMNTLCFSAGDHLEGIRAFEEKRPPRF